MNRFITLTVRDRIGNHVGPRDGSPIRVERFAINSYELFVDGVTVLYDGATLQVYETLEQLDEMLNTPISIFEKVSEIR